MEEVSGSLLPSHRRRTAELVNILENDIFACVLFDVKKHFFLNTENNEFVGYCPGEAFGTNILDGLFIYSVLSSDGKKHSE